MERCLIEKGWNVKMMVVGPKGYARMNVGKLVLSLGEIVDPSVLSAVVL